MCSSTPDTSGINRAAEANAGIAQEALDWYKQAYADSAPERAAAAARAGEVSDAQLEAMREATRQSRSTSDFMDRNLRPLQQSIVDDANNFDTEQKREELAGLALGDVNAGFASARAQAQRDMARRGVNVNDGNYGSAIKQLALGQAVAGADAKNKARTGAMTLAAAKKADAVAALSGLPANSATQAGLALTSGNSSVGNAQVPLQVAQQGAQLAGQGFSTAIQGNSSSGNLYGQAAQLSNQPDNTLGGITNLAMAGKYIFSDKKMKTSRRRVKGDVALAAARKMPVDSWKYKPGSPGDDGGKTHVGPMAQDVHAALGEGAAPGGKVVDVGSVAGAALAAVQEMDKRHQRLEKKVISLASAVKKAGKQPRASEEDTAELA